MIVIVDELFPRVSPYELGQMRKRGEVLTLDDFRTGGRMYEEYIKDPRRRPSVPVVAEVIESYEPLHGTLTLRENAHTGHLEFWKCRWDSS